ncbi:MAG TPA: SOS response-associated peptidase [Nitrococcus sp.]|jgi:putative SOS response-associated peptidase YedK|nr:SOS response-associated peptidase [Nitrococcus sp.]
MTVAQMCGRYASFLPPEAIARIFRTVNPLPNVEPNWNMAPTLDAMVVRRHPQTGERHLDLLNWGLLPYWTKGDPKKTRRPINAKAETIGAQSMFREAFARRRCLVPAGAFYEWQPVPGEKAKQPFAIARQDGLSMALAGIWEGWRGEGGEVLRTFAIITTDANRLMAPIHNRMPVILEEADWPLWLGETEDRDPAELLHPAAEDALRVWPVSRAVSNVRNNGPELLESFAQEQ